MYDTTFNDLIRDAVRYKPASVAVDNAKPDDNVAFDAAIAYFDSENRMLTAALMHEWIETDDLAENETLADRLLNLSVGLATDASINGELNDQQQEDVNAVFDSMSEWLVEKGIEIDDVESLLNDWCVDTANNIRDYLITSIDDSDLDNDIISFAFDTANEVSLDAAIRKRKDVVRNGKVIRGKMVKVGGTVRLSGAQKNALNKLHKRPRTARQKLKQKRSMMIRGKRGLDKHHRAKVV
jgi:hypothetical protein